MSNFSGAVKLADLNDFIAPSQACVVNLETLKDKPLVSDFEESGVVLQPKAAKGGWSQTLPTKSEADPVKISLQDCLACSGCVTSAETVLLEHQSIEELAAKLADPTVTVVVSLSRQSVASLGAARGLDPRQTAGRLCAFLRGVGVAAVLDCGSGRDVALLEAATEFLARYRAAHGMGSDASCRVEAESDQERRNSGASATASGRPPQASKKQSKGPGRRAGNLPVLASSCPGWVCYSEKTHGDYVLPHISTAKSPQAVMGSLVKRFWAKQNGVVPASIYHCSIMPCFDKKLEAARDDFDLPGGKVPETDSVLTTTEVLRLLEVRGVDLRDLPEEELNTPLGGRSSELAGLPGGSGGYMDYIYRVAARQLFNVEVPEGPLPLRALRNTDFQEITLEVGGKTVLRFALTYGFRNIQTLLRKLKPGLSQYDYVEVMACPSGCVNGGGQLPPPPGVSVQDSIADVSAVYHHPQIKRQRPEENADVQQLYTQWVGGSPASHQALDLLHTQYHKREKSLASAVKDW